MGLAAFARSNHGGVATMVAVTLPLLIGLIFGAMDISRAVSTKQILQDSLDGATLFAARSTATSDADLQAIGAKAMAANILNMNDGTLVSVSFKAGENGQKVIASATGSVPTTILGLVGQPSLGFDITTEVTRSSKNLEVALVLDATYSMKGQNIEDMKVAAASLIDIVVRDSQTPFYSKVALVPYSMAVNAGTYADQARGTISAAKTITGATKNNPVVITATGHGFANGDKVYISGVKGMTYLNGKTYVVANKETNKFSLKSLNGNNIDGTKSDYKTYTSGGSAWCTKPGCQYYNFESDTGGNKTFEVSTCVTERSTNPYTDAAPSTTLLGRNYPSTGNPCLPNIITPLSSNKTTLKASLTTLQAGGSTGGQIGVAWGWYMVAPNFGYLWPSASVPAAYTATDLIKAVVIMTDGEYNSVYCNGVIAKDSTTGSGSSNDHESCNSPNGSSYYQAGQLCTKMKAAGVIVYTVGFQVVDTQNARDLVNNCATDAAHVYLPATGADLKTAFQAIGQDLSRLRISQ